MSTRWKDEAELAHPDEVDDEGVEEPEHELGQQLMPLLHVCCRRSLLLRRGTCWPEPVAVQNREALKQGVERRRLVASQCEKGGDVCDRDVSTREIVDSEKCTRVAGQA